MVQGANAITHPRRNYIGRSGYTPHSRIPGLPNIYPFRMLGPEAATVDHKRHVNRRILPFGSKAQGAGDSRKPVLWEPYINIIPAQTPNSMGRNIWAE